MTSPLKFLSLELLFDGSHYGMPASDADWQQAIADYPVAGFTRVIDHVEPHVILRVTVAVTCRRPGEGTTDLLLGIVRATPRLHDRFREYAREVVPGPSLAAVYQGGRPEASAYGSRDEGGGDA
jgi:hypothetical protein